MATAVVTRAERSHWLLALFPRPTTAPSPRNASRWYAPAAISTTLVACGEKLVCPSELSPKANSATTVSNASGLFVAPTLLVTSTEYGPLSSFEAAGTVYELPVAPGIFVPLNRH